MKPHKWAKEIKAWADGAEIEVRVSDSNHAYVWTDCETPMFDTNEKWEYRIKPQPKEDIIKMTCCFCGQVIPYNTYHACTTEHNIKPQPKELPEVVKHWLSLGVDMETIEKTVVEVINKQFPKPKEPQYLYVLREQGKSDYWLSPFPASVKNVKTIGKIKLEVDDE